MAANENADMIECDEDELWDDDDDDDNDDDDEEECEIQGCVKCLFCDDIMTSASLVYKHCDKEHNFNINNIRRVWNLDSISYIKMVNYIRLKCPRSNDIKIRKLGESLPWSDDNYMKPADVEDLLLQYDIESEVMETIVENDEINNEEITLSKSEYHSLLQQVHMAQSRATSTERELLRAEEDLNKLRITAKEFVLSQPNIPVGPARVDSLQDGDDDSYFDSYSHFDIHHQMLQDKVRTESYRDFMLNNTEYFKDKVVLDVGCGTGILAMFAAKAGASHVIGVDQSEIIYQAMDIVRENGLDDKITLLKGRLEDVDLPYKKVDVIISEWMGYFLLFESMLDTVLTARDRYLKPDGMVFPDICNISLAAVCDMKLYNKDILFWDDVYGFKMSCIKSEVTKEACIDVIDNSNIISHPCILKTIDVSECKVEDLQFQSDFKLPVTSDGEVTAFLGYFDIYFDKGLKNKVNFSTGPHSTPTHWKQTVFLLPKPVRFNIGDIVEGSLSCRKNRKDPRSLVISIKYNNIKHLYIME